MRNALEEIMDALQKGPSQEEELPRYIRIPKHRIRIRNRCFVMHPMVGKRLIEWLELQILCAKEKFQAVTMLREQPEELEKALVRLLTAGDRLVQWALDCDAQFVEQLTQQEKQKVIDIQDRLNQVDELAKVLDVLGIGLSR